MKTQSSHPSTRVNSQYSGVYQQQGRMITDADWNAMTDIEKQRLKAALLDVINSGAPRKGGLALLKYKTNPDDQNDQGILKIKAGVLYVDGLRAELPGPGPYRLDEQPHYPIASYPGDLPDFNGAGKLRLYADVWERSVTALEDPGLMDPALHGADTTSRSETLLQIKWRPEDSEQPPGIGNAELALSLRNIYVSNDHCDPCATEMDLDERIGNYLFRVEVHDLETTSSGDRILTLKWSRDNGAEAHAADNYPMGFNRGNWVWEFFDENSEKSLGLHFSAESAPKRGHLTTQFSVPDKAPNSFVRQWDGYLKLNLTQKKLVKDGDDYLGVDRGTPLTPGDARSSEANAHGWLNIDDSGILELNTEQLEWRLHFEGRDFVPGDYWQVAIREAVHKSGEQVLGEGDAGALPLGVQHHYLDLKTLNDQGDLVSLGEAHDRQLEFPALTSLTAADIGLGDIPSNNHCDWLYGSSHNVEDALEALCGINAGDIPLNGSLCETFTRDNAKTVQDALNALCARETQSGGCARVVEPGQLAEVLEYAAKEAIAKGNETLWLCLKAGEHTWPRDLQAHHWRHVRISGAGPLATHLYFEEIEEKPNLVGGQQISLQELSLQSVFGLTLAGEEITLQGVRVNSNKVGDKPLPEIAFTDLREELIKAHLGQRFREGETTKQLGEHTLNRVRLEHCHIASARGAAVFLQRPRETCHFNDNTILGEVRLGEHDRPENTPMTLDVDTAKKIKVSKDRDYVTTKRNPRFNAEEVRISQDGPEEAHHKLRSRTPMAHRNSHIFLNNNWVSRWLSVFHEDDLKPKQEDSALIILPGPASLQASGNIFGYESSFHAEQLTFQNNRIAPILNGQQPKEAQPQLVLVANQFIAQGNMGEVEKKEQEGGGGIFSPPSPEEEENNKLVHALLIANISMHSNNLIKIDLLA